LIDEEKKQSNRMFARELAAGTGAFVAHICTVNTNAVRVFPAALAFAPDRIIAEA
jgi:hypothetical protein